MASGEHLRGVTFDSEVREKLAELLAPTLKNRLGPAGHHCGCHPPA